MPLSQPLPSDHDPEVKRLSQCFNTTLGFPSHGLLTMMRRPALAHASTELEAPAAEDGMRWLARQAWASGKHAGLHAGLQSNAS